SEPIPHSSEPIPHSEFRIPHSSEPIPHSEFRIPQSEYSARLAARNAQLAVYAARFRVIGLVRIALLVAGLVVMWLGLSSRPAIAWALIPIGLASLALLLRHQRVFFQRQRMRRAARFYEAGLECLAGAWPGKGVKGTEYQQPAHPYANDIDLFGHGSLFELLCAARTRMGEQTLAAWLQAPAELAVVRARQQAVAELRGAIDLREDLALAGADVRSALEPDKLAAWAAAPPVFTSTVPRLIALLLTGLVITALALWIMNYGTLLLLISMLLNGMYFMWMRARVAQVTGAAPAAARHLALLSELLGRIEGERFTSPLLTDLRARLDTDGRAPSAQIARLRRLLAWLDARLNQFFMPFAYAFLWQEHFSFAIETWRIRSGPQVARWLAAIGEIEALLSLAAYAYEHPGDPFPDLIESGPLFTATSLGHPLIPESRCVRADVSLDSASRLLVVSGSNMSGKSTLLRSIGVNTTLALAGAPVRAAALRLSPLRLGASIQIQDNLQAGASLFYAEITRLRQLMQMTGGAAPLLFIVDEILHGTNSHDRRLGAEAILKGLVARGAIGLVTTHDLALTRLAETPGNHAINVHFEDHLENGQMKFDYILRPGVVTKSNAIELMRSVGLDV
ncbi:MAG: MutS-related protein, partial [Blastocatellia bacterium]